MDDFIFYRPRSRYFIGLIFTRKKYRNRYIQYRTHNW